MPASNEARNRAKREGTLKPLGKGVAGFPEFVYLRPKVMFIHNCISTLIANGHMANLCQLAEQGEWQIEQLA